MFFVAISPNNELILLNEFSKTRQKYNLVQNKRKREDIVQLTNNRF